MPDFRGQRGITVAFSPYTIAPYAAGEQSFQVPYSLPSPTQ
ncbi:MAG: RsiV family protein [Vescimonas sp.]